MGSAQADPEVGLTVTDRSGGLTAERRTGSGPRSRTCSPLCSGAVTPGRPLISLPFLLVWTN